MPSVKLYSEVNRLKAWVKRLKRSVQLRDERIEVLTAEGLGLQESLTVVGEQRDEALERIHTLEEGMTATGLGLTNDLVVVREELRVANALAEELIEEACRARKWIGKPEDWAYDMGVVDLYEGAVAYLNTIGRHLTPAEAKAQEEAGT